MLINTVRHTTNTTPPPNTSPMDGSIENAMAIPIRDNAGTGSTIVTHQTTAC